MNKMCLYLVDYCREREHMEISGQPEMSQRPQLSSQSQSDTHRPYEHARTDPVAFHEMLVTCRC